MALFSSSSSSSSSSTSSDSNSTTGVGVCFSFSVEGSEVEATEDLDAEEVVFGSGRGGFELVPMWRARG